MGGEVWWKGYEKMGGVRKEKKRERRIAGMRENGLRGISRGRRQ